MNKQTVINHPHSEERRKHLSQLFYEMFCIMIICSIIGCGIEMVFCRITNGYWESRTSLVYGPFGLAYGIGGVLLSLLLLNDKDASVPKVFIKAFFWCSVAEYIMSLGEELVFHHVSWDYSEMPLNINGRVCFLYSLFWGVLGLAWAKFIYPGFKSLLSKIPPKPGQIIYIIMLIFFIYDCFISVEATVRYNARQDGIVAKNSYEQLLDKQFPDKYMETVFANAMNVDKDGNVSETNLAGNTTDYIPQK